MQKAGKAVERILENRWVYLSDINQQPRVERTLIQTQPELGVVIRRYGELEVTWRGGAWTEDDVSVSTEYSLYNGDLSEPLITRRGSGDEVTAAQRTSSSL